MSALLLPNTIDNDTPADAVEVEQNYAYIQSYINNDVIRRDGATAMAAPLLLVGDPSADNHAATKAYVDAILPVGVILPYGGVTAPAGRWALANGAAVAAATYPELFGVFAYRYGGSGGSFNLPNFAARVPIGVDATQERFDTTGKTGGSTLVPVPQHNHPMPHTHSIDHNHASGTTGTDGAHQHVGEFTAHEIGAHGSGGYWVARRITDSGSGAFITTVGGGAHAHTVDLPNFTGTSGAVSTANTSNAGTAGAEHLAPYVVVQYIVRLD